MVRVYALARAQDKEYRRTHPEDQEEEELELADDQVGHHKQGEPNVIEMETCVWKHLGAGLLKSPINSPLKIFLFYFVQVRFIESQSHLKRIPTV